MFSFFRRSPKESIENSPDLQPQISDTALIAVISAAIARFREESGAQHSDAGFVVRRVRRI